MKRFILPLVAALGIGASAAQASETLTIYSYRQPFLVEHLFEKFTEQTGIDVEVLYAKKGLIERLKLEGAHSPADILLSNNSLRLLEAKAAGLTQPIDHAVVTDRVPENLRDADGHWIGLTRRGRVLYTNKDTVAEGTITDYTDLAQSDYRICLRSWRHAYNISLVAYLIESIGEPATEAWVRAVNDRLGRKPQGNDRAQIRAVNAGECDIGIANSYYFGVMQADPKQAADTVNVTAIFPTLAQEHGTFGFISGLALLKSTDYPEAAAQLIAFMLSPEAQAIYAEVNHEFPVYAVGSDTHPNEAKLDSKPLSQVFAKRGAALDLINRVVD